MKIAINCWVLRNKNIDGIGNFTIETLRPLMQAHPEIEFFLLCDKNFTGTYFDFPNVSKFYIYPPYRHPILYPWFMEIVTGRFLSRFRPDVFLSMEGFLCLRSQCRQLPLIYDLNFEHRPQDLPFRNRVYFRTFFRRFAKKATRIATISEYSKTDISKTYGIDPGKIDNVSCGVKEKFGPLTEDAKRAAKAKFSNGEDYFFFVGSMHPRKNIVRLLQAFETFKFETGSNLKLILAGNIAWDNESIRIVIAEMKSGEDVIFVGRVSDEQLGLLLGSAFCLSFVPTFEGFGLPIVEAFQCEVPVICSNTTSMPEVAGNAALLVDPFDVEAISNAMKKMFADEDLRAALIAKGREQKKLFSWQRTANLLFECIENCAAL